MKEVAARDDSLVAVVDTLGAAADSATVSARSLLTQVPLTEGLLRAALIVLASWLAAWLVERFFTGWIQRLTRRTRTSVDDRLVALLHRPVFLTVFLFGLSLATERLPIPTTFLQVTISILQTITVLVWMGFGFRAPRLVLEVTSRQTRGRLIDERTIPLFENLTKMLILALGIYVMLKVWRVDATAWLASAGIVGLAIGFAAKDTLANLFSGIFIMADAPYKVGDYINLDTGERGQVTTIGLRSTRLLTRDDVEITIPNAVIANAKIVNESGGPWVKHRVRAPIGVAYGSDVDQVIEVLSAVPAEVPEVADDPEPRVRFRGFGNSSLDFEVLAWITEPATRGLVVHKLNVAIYKALRREGIEIPFPKRDLYVREWPGRPEAPEA